MRDRKSKSEMKDKMEIKKDKTEEEKREIGEARKKTEKEWEVLFA